MVHMRNQMRERGLEETGELPDHLVHVLAVLADMDEEPAREMARACVCPALGKMLASIDKEQVKAEAAAAKTQADRTPTNTARRYPVPATSQPFRPLVEALAELVLEEFDLPRSALGSKEKRNRIRFPPALIRCTALPCDAGLCGGCGGMDVPVPPPTEPAPTVCHGVQERRS